MMFDTHDRIEWKIIVNHWRKAKCIMNLLTLGHNKLLKDYWLTSTPRHQKHAIMMWGTETHQSKNIGKAQFDFRIIGDCLQDIHFDWTRGQNWRESYTFFIRIIMITESSVGLLVTGRIQNSSGPRNFCKKFYSINFLRFFLSQK